MDFSFLQAEFRGNVEKEEKKIAFIPGRGLFIRKKFYEVIRKNFWIMILSYLQY
jgi:hypothetical protein